MLNFHYLLSMSLVYHSGRLYSKTTKTITIVLPDSVMSCLDTSVIKCTFKDMFTIYKIKLIGYSSFDSAETSGQI